MNSSEKTKWLLLYSVHIYMSCARFLLCEKDKNVNGKFHPKTGHEGPERGIEV